MVTEWKFLFSGVTALCFGVFKYSLYSIQVSSNGYVYSSYKMKIALVISKEALVAEMKPPPPPAPKQ